MAYKTKEAYNAWKRQYRQTKRGYLGRKHDEMKKRVTGRCNSKSKSYIGLPICDRISFREWAENDETFNKLWNIWHVNGKEYKLTPSIDRIEESKGYILDNLRWVTVSENTIKENNRRKG
jgi:hypothetical protein